LPGTSDACGTPETSWIGSASIPDPKKEAFCPMLSSITGSC